LVSRRTMTAGSIGAKRYATHARSQTRGPHVLYSTHILARLEMTATGAMIFAGRIPNVGPCRALTARLLSTEVWSAARRGRPGLICPRARARARIPTAWSSILPQRRRGRVSAGGARGRAPRDSLTHPGNRWKISSCARPPAKNGGRNEAHPGHRVGTPSAKRCGTRSCTACLFFAVLLIPVRPCHGQLTCTKRSHDPRHRAVRHRCLLA